MRVTQKLKTNLERTQGVLGTTTISQIRKESKSHTAVINWARTKSQVFGFPAIFPEDRTTGAGRTGHTLVSLQVGMGFHIYSFGQRFIATRDSKI